MWSGPLQFHCQLPVHLPSLDEPGGEGVRSLAGSGSLISRAADLAVGRGASLADTDCKWGDGISQAEGSLIRSALALLGAACAISITFSGEDGSLYFAYLGELDAVWLAENGHPLHGHLPSFAQYGQTLAGGVVGLSLLKFTSGACDACSYACCCGCA